MENIENSGATDIEIEQPIEHQIVQPREVIQCPPYGEIIESWLHDLIGNIPHLRSTDSYNTLRKSVDELKKRLG